MAEGEAVPAAQRGSWGQFLKQLASFSGDLSSLTAPSFILSPTSLCEFSTYMGEVTEAFAACSASVATTPEERILAVTRWWILQLKGSFTRREDQTGSEKKPLNPVLGEQFLGKWPESGSIGETTLVSEQVSHHPPINAYYIENKAAKVSLQGHCAQKTSFSGKSINVKQVGHAIMRITLPDGKVESYLCTLPKLRIEGLLFGSPSVELSESSDIHGSTGWHTHIEYKGRGWTGGKSHSFTASVAPSANEAMSKKPTHVIEGVWTGASSFTSGPRAKKPFADASAANTTREIEVAPIDSQGPMESRRVWRDVADGIRKGQFDQASAAKSKLENDQRQKRKDEVAGSKPFQLAFFTHVESDEDYAILAAGFGHTPSTQEGFLRNAQ